MEVHVGLVNSNTTKYNSSTLLKIGRYYNTTVGSLLGHVSKIVSILLSKLATVPILTRLCYCNYPFLTVYIHM